MNRKNTLACILFLSLASRVLSAVAYDCPTFHTSIEKRLDTYKTASRDILGDSEKSKLALSQIEAYSDKITNDRDANIKKSGDELKLNPYLVGVHETLRYLAGTTNNPPSYTNESINAAFFWLELEKECPKAALRGYLLRTNIIKTILTEKKVGKGVMGPLYIAVSQIKDEDCYDNRLDGELYKICTQAYSWIMANSVNSDGDFTLVLSALTSLGARIAIANEKEIGDIYQSYIKTLNLTKKQADALSSALKNVVTQNGGLPIDKLTTAISVQNVMLQPQELIYLKYYIQTAPELFR